MAIKQLSVFLENTPGTLCETVAAITDAGINIRALSVADTEKYGILRIIVSDIEKTKAAIKNDTVVKETPVIAVKMNDEAGALGSVLKVFRSAGINVEYIYAFTGAVQGNAYVVIRVDDIETAEKKLFENGIKALNDEDIKEYLN